MAISLVAIGYVTWRAFGSTDESALQSITPRFVAVVAAAGCLYAGLAVLIGLAWHVLLASTRAAKLPWRESLIIFGRSQILKYLPSNLLHYVGRHAAAYSAGVPHGTLVWSSMAEAVFVTVTAAGVTAVFAHPVLTQSLDRLQSPSWVRTVLLGLVLLAFTVATVYLFRRNRDAPAKSYTSLAIGAAIACALYVVFFIGNGALLAGLAASLAGSDLPSSLVLAGVVSLAWFMGFLVPGAPAGLGVRELILTMGLELTGFRSEAAAIALSYRLVTLLGDVLLALGAVVLSRRRSSKSA
jgi:hypothetical protein